MKKTYLSFVLIAILLIIHAFRPVLTPVEATKENYLRDLTVFENTLEKLKTETQKHPLSINDLQADFKAARLAYKRIAWLIGYLDPDGEKDFNGAPLPETEPLQFSEIPPLGFQPIEEIIFSDNPEEEVEKLRDLTQKLQFNAKNWHIRMTDELLCDRQIMEAFRVELVQLFSLSLSGFDSPVAVHSLPEALIAWSSLEENMRFYEKDIEKLDPSVSKLIFKIFAEGETYFRQNQDFDTFDRVVFYKKHLQPLYALIVKAQQIQGIEFYNLTSGLRRAWNDEATSIFDKNFIDPKFYSKIKQKNHEDTPERIQLGRLLFFDPVLSSNGKRACASCHRPENALAEPLPKSLDLEGKPLSRNAPSLMYSAVATSQFWDGHADDVEAQLLHVASNLREMGNAIEDVPVRLAKSKEYLSLFDKAFPNQEEALRLQNVQKAMGAYIRSLAVFDSEFDKFMRGETAKIDPSVQRGFNLFMGKAKCGTCHFAPVFNGSVPPQYLDTEFEVIGVPDEKGNLDADLGKYSIYPSKKFRNSFKTVTVRNAALSAPYMHNGVHKTLAEVVSFYNKGGGKGMGLDVPNQTLPFDKLNLTKKEEHDIVKFMETLTDKELPKAPDRLPLFDTPSVIARKIGGAY
jgi:cytochrome c peroxidase